MISIISLLASPALLWGAHFSVHTPIVVQEEIVVHKVRPCKRAVKIGTICVDGGQFSDYEDLLAEATRKAAKLGGDYVLEEDSGYHTKTSFSPGYPVIHTRVYGRSHRHGFRSSYGFWVRPSVHKEYRPWGTFSVWAYSCG